ncbi:response regulator [Mangrovibacterium sp.]|uniref:response regulator n=1 Tax=Mangrovibacterium sp. TaxID=1961364 RepID=UPI0035614062
MIVVDSMKILIAEDVESNYLYLNAVLSKIKAEIVWAKNGLEAVDLFKKHQDFDLILMDLQMPEMNGYEATRIIKSINPSIPIIAQTAFAMAEDRAKALNAGCNEYLAKPIRSKDLLNLVEKFMHV